MTLPPSAFAATFRANAIPRLARMAEARGLFVALGLETPTEAHAALMAEAWRHRAQYLPPEHFDHLEAWALDALLAAAAKHDDMLEERAARLAHVTADVERWDAQVRGVG